MSMTEKLVLLVAMVIYSLFTIGTWEGFKYLQAHLVWQ